MAASLSVIEDLGFGLANPGGVHAITNFPSDPMTPFWESIDYKSLAKSGVDLKTTYSTFNAVTQAINNPQAVNPKAVFQAELTPKIVPVANPGLLPIGTGITSPSFIIPQYPIMPPFVSLPFPTLPQVGGPPQRTETRQPPAIVVIGPQQPSTSKTLFQIPNNHTQTVPTVPVYQHVASTPTVPVYQPTVPAPVNPVPTVPVYQPAVPNLTIFPNMYPKMSQVSFPQQKVKQPMIPLAKPTIFVDKSLLAPPLTAAERAAVNDMIMDDGQEIDLDRISGDNAPGGRRRSDLKPYSLATLRGFASRLGLKMDSKPVLAKRILEVLKSRLEQQSAKLY